MDKILFVVTSHSTLKNGTQTGLWLEEYAVPFMLWREAGYEIEVVSLLGGQAPVDPNSMPDKGYCSDKFRNNMDKYTSQMSEAQVKLHETIKLVDVDSSDYMAVYYPGGHGCLWDVCQQKKSVELLDGFIREEKLIVAICHACGILAVPKGDDNQYWIKDRSVTGFSNAEEQQLHLEDEIPFSVEDKLIQAGALYSCVKPADSFVTQDERIITGQNSLSSWELAKKVLHVLDNMYEKR